MTNSVTAELEICVLCLMCGMLSGVLYDCFKALRKLNVNNPTIVFIQDILFWILNAFLVFYMIFVANSGIIRWYETTLAAIGFMMYMISLSGIISTTLEKTVKLIIRIIKIFIKILLSPIYVLRKPFKKMFVRLRKTEIIRWIIRLFKKKRGRH